MGKLKLFMALLGGKPPGRHIEQHDIFFGIGERLKDLIPLIDNYWPEGRGYLHIDGWREVTAVEGYQIEINERADNISRDENKLFFINLGGYEEGLFDERHFKLLIVEKNMAAAVKKAKETPFYKTVQFPGASSHIDDRYELDVDDIYDINEILPLTQKEKYTLKITPGMTADSDILNLGYFKFDKLP